MILFFHISASFSLFITIFYFERSFLLPREARKRSATDIYHVVIRGMDHQLMFEEEQDYKMYLQFLKEYKEEFKFELYAYCLMPNHIHLLVKMDFEKMGEKFKKINSNYAVWFNAKYFRSGHLQQGRYYADNIESEEYFINAIRYIHYNPLKAGLEKELATKYTWNSVYQYIESKAGLADIDLAKETVAAKDYSVFYSSEGEGKFTDFENFKRRLSDKEAWAIISRLTGCQNTVEFKKMPIEEKERLIPILNSKNISQRQLSRLTGLSLGKISRIVLHKKSDEFKRTH